jgi:hypothetical protein
VTRRPALHLVVALEDEPVARLTADTAENEERLRLWLEHPDVQERLTDALLEALRKVTR